MNSFGVLLRLSIRNRLAMFRFGSWKKENGKFNAKRLLITFAMVLVLLAGVSGIVYLQYMFSEKLSTIRQAVLLPTLAVLIAMVGTLVLGVMHVLASLFYNRDIPWLAYLPIGSHTLFAARLSEVYIGQWLANCAILLPAFVLYGLKGHFGADYYIRAVIIIMVSAGFPLAVSTLVASIVARVTAHMKHKELVAMLLSIVMTASGLGLQVASVLPDIPTTIDVSALAKVLVKLLIEKEIIFNAITNIFPPARWAIHGLQGNWLELLYFVLCSVLPFIASAYFLGNGYIKTCLAQGEREGKTKKIRKTRRLWKQSAPLRALYQREMSEIFRTPVYAMNSLAPVVMGVVLLLTGIFTIRKSGTEFMDAVQLFTQLLVYVHPADILLFIMTMLGFFSTLNPAIATAVSREGVHHDMSCMIPITPRIQLRAKMMMGMTLATMGSVVAGCIGVVLFPSSALLIVVALVLVSLLQYTVCACSLTLDTLRPHFHWNNENQAMKKNLNVLFSYGIGLVCFALPVLAAVGLNPVIQERWLILGIVLLVVIAEAVASHFLLQKVAEKAYLHSVE